MKAQRAIACLLTGSLAAALMNGIVQVSAEEKSSDKAAFSISTVIAAEDGSFETTVNLDSIPKSGLCALDFAVAYDSAALSISGVNLLYDTGAQEAETAVNPNLADTVFSAEDTGSEIRVRWATALLNPVYWLKEEKPLLKISGTLNTDSAGSCSWLRIIPASRETYEGSGRPNTAIVAGYVDGSGKAYRCETLTEDGAVWTVLDHESGATMYGDVDMDGTRSLSDVILMCRMICEDTPHLCAAAYANADCEKDGTITMADVSLMLQVLNGQEEAVSLGK